MLDIGLALIASLAWGVGDFAQGTAARRFTPIAIMLCTRVGAVLLVGLGALLFGPPALGSRWPLAIGDAFLTVGGTIALMRALAIGPMGVAAPIIAMSGAVPAVWGIFEQPPSGPALAGLALAVAGTGLASRSLGVSGERVDPRGVGFALLAALLIGANMLVLHVAANHSPIMAVLTERSTEVVIVLLALLAFRARGPGLSLPDPKGAGTLMTIGAIDAVAVTSYIAASIGPSLAAAAVLSSLYPVVTVLLARSFHHERLSRLQIAGATLTFAGVALVALAGTG